MTVIFMAKSTLPLIGPIIDLIAGILGIFMDWIFRATSLVGLDNIGLCIIIFTIIINIFMLPLTIKQQKSAKLMGIIQPEIQSIQKKYQGKTDQESSMRMQAEMSAVYKKYGTSMTGGCSQLLIQLPILFALYQVINNIPTYVPSVMKYFDIVAREIQSQPDFSNKISEIATSLRMNNHDFNLIPNLVDLLYKFTPANWESLKGIFPALTDTISVNSSKIISMNDFLGINLSSAPWNGGKPTLAWLIPILSGLSQWYSTKLMTAAQGSSSSSGEGNSVAQSMKTMNMVMPLMSVFFCFTLPAGLGVYWVAAAVCRIVQQWFIDSKFKGMDVDEIIKQNLEKINKKRARQGLPPQKLDNKTNSTISSYEENVSKEASNKEKKLAQIAKQVKDSNSYYNQNAKPGSLASKANMVSMYDKKISESKSRKKADSGEAESDTDDSTEQ